MSEHKRTVWGSLVAWLLSICGCGQPAAPPSGGGPSLIEEIAVNGFDPEGEPILKKWSDGTIWIHFETMPPSFAEEQGNERDFDDFERELHDALGVAVRRDDREVFVIERPAPDTAEKAKAWLEAYRKIRP